LIFSIGALIILQSVGISITPLVTALGIGGLAVALALQPTLSNLFAGLQIIISKQVEVGDYVQLDSGQKGYVTDVSWRNTKIRELPNNLIVVPNSKLADSIVTNFNQPQKEMSVLVKCGVSYDSDLEKVEKVTIDVAKKVLKKIQGGESEFEPFIRFHTFGDSSIDFSVILRVKEFVNKYLIRHEFIKALHKRYNKEGINIPFPIRTVYMKDKI
jgi:small-conductance mechanosensitive channel